MTSSLREGEVVGLNRKQPWLGKRTAIGLTRFLLINGMGVAVTLAWQSYGDEMREIMANSYPLLGWLAPETPAIAKTASEMAPARPPTTSPDSQEIEVVSLGLATLRQSMDQLAAQFVASQEQMAGDIAKLKADEQVILANMSLAPLPRPAAAPGHSATGRQPPGSGWRRK
jgi:hypothetical protein